MKKFFILAFLLVSTVVFADDIQFLGLNPNQPYSPGDLIFFNKFTPRCIDCGSIELKIYYKEIKEGSIFLESYFEDIRLFKFPLNSQQEATVNLTDHRKSYLLTVVNKDEIVATEAAEYDGSMPIKFYPDLKQAYVAMSEDFEAKNLDSQIKKIIDVSKKGPSDKLIEVRKLHDQEEE